MTGPEINWDEADKWDAEQAHEELEGMVANLAATNGEVRRLLCIQDEQSETIRIAGKTDAIEIKIRAVVPWNVRARIARMGTEMKRIARQEAEEWKKIAAGEDVEIQEVDIIQVQRPMYEVMADLCLEEPWTDWKTWAAFDVRTGAGPKILDQIMQKIAPEEGRIKTFRGKR